MLRLAEPIGWNMTTLLPELAATLLANVQVDGELVATFEDGDALFEVVCERGGKRSWVKTKNRQTPRFAEELAGPERHRRRAFA